MTYETFFYGLKRKKKDPISYYHVAKEYLSYIDLFPYSDCYLRLSI
jgi:hypothetical protein